MPNPDRIFDKTSLTIDTAEERIMIHRDYLAHCLRWSHVARELMRQKTYATARILDVGCGKEFPLAKMLYSNRMSGASYVGVDLNSLSLPEMLQKAVESGKIRVRYKEKCDVTKLTLEDLPWFKRNPQNEKYKVGPTHVVCFEVFEHMHPKQAIRMLKAIYNMMDHSSTLYFSTPCWNGKAAANHINETTYQAMGSILETTGFHIDGHWGTFASIADYRGHMDSHLIAAFDTMREYYDTNLLSVMWAPMFPQYSRNVMWQCSLAATNRFQRQFPFLHEVREPWGQHKDWR